MKKVSNEELINISNFMASVDDMIHGKFILADIKISKILDIINSSEEMFRYISECMINFDYIKEFGRAEIKNSFNQGEYKCPEEPEKIVALVFCMLHDFSVKKLDFYNFIKTNFGAAGEVGQYKAFADTLLIPFKNIIAEYFNTENTSNDIKQNDDIIEKEPAFADIDAILKQIINTVKNDKKIKIKHKDDILFILRATEYSLKYNDIKLVSALLTAFEYLAKKVQSIKYLYNDLKQVILNYYQNN